MDEVFYNDIAGSLQFSRSVTNSETDYGVDRAVSDTIKSTCRSTGTGDWHITFNGSGANNIKGIIICGLNTGTWTTLQAQGDDADFAGAPAATSNFTVKTRTLYRYDAASRMVVSAPRYDAYIKETWGYQDYRIKFNSAAVSYYDIGRVYIFTGNNVCTRNPNAGAPGGIMTTCNIVSGEGGQLISTPKYQQFIYDMNFSRTDRTEIDWIEKILPLNPSLIWAVDGLTSGQLIFGKVTTGLPSTIGLTFGDDANINVKLTEAL